MKKQTRVWLVVSIALSLAALGSACSKTPEPVNDGGGAATAAKYTGPTGTVTGVVSFNGTAPAPTKIDSTADPVCGKQNPNLETEITVVKDGKLANAFVYIKDGTTTDGKKVGDFTWDTPTAAAQLDQNGCHYRPHVLGVQTNQKISITNSDPTTHNIHPTPKQNPEWNQSQPSGAAPIEKSFARSEILVPVKCNQHPWMKAYIGVMKTPFFAVSADNGSFTIKGVPAGTYTVAAWHEGGVDGTTKTVQVTVPANGSATADFAFEGAATSANQQGGLKMMPAIEFPMLGRKH